MHVHVQIYMYILYFTYISMLFFTPYPMTCALDRIISCACLSGCLLDDKDYIFLTTYVVFFHVLFRSKALERDQAKELLRVIRKRGTSAFDKFVEVLLESDTMSFLGKRLKEEAWEDDNQYGKYNVHVYRIAGKFGGELNLAVCVKKTAKLKSAKFFFTHACTYDDTVPYRQI